MRIQKVILGCNETPRNAGGCVVEEVERLNHVVLWLCLIKKKITRRLQES